MTIASMIAPSDWENGVTERPVDGMQSVRAKKIRKALERIDALRGTSATGRRLFARTRWIGAVLVRPMNCITVLWFNVTIITIRFV